MATIPRANIKPRLRAILVITNISFTPVLNSRGVYAAGRLITRFETFG
jgi:hypothetical protein